MAKKRNSLFDDIHPEPNTGCWLWSGARAANGYGFCRHPITRRMSNVHRVVYEQECGPIPKGLDLDHLCRNPACVNPDHLEPVTRAVNLARGCGAAVSSKRMRGNQLRRKYRIHNS